MKIFALLITLLVFFANTRGSYQYNKIPIGGRTAALGGHIPSVANAYSVYENPSLLAVTDSDYASFSYNRLLQDMTTSSLLFHKRFNKFNLSAGASNFTINDIPLYPDHPTENPTGYFDTHHINAIIGAGFNVSPQAVLGVSVRYLYQKLYETHSQATSFDVGFSYRPKILERLTLALTANNLGLSKKIDEKELKLPFAYGGGLSYVHPVTPEHSLMLAYNVKVFSDQEDNPYDDKETIHNISTELKLFNKFAILMSYHTSNELYENLSYGFQLHWKSFSFDYANASTTDDLDSNQFITISKYF